MASRKKIKGVNFFPRPSATLRAAPLHFAGGRFSPLGELEGWGGQKMQRTPKTTGFFPNPLSLEPKSML